MLTTNLLSISNLGYVYPGASEPALENVQLDIDKQNVLAVLGASGSGKTTFGMILANILPRLFGGEITGSVERAANFSSAMIFDNPELQIVELRVGDELRVALRNSGCQEGQIENRVDELLVRVGLGPKWKKRWVWDLSPAEQQRLVLATVLSKKHDLIILDSLSERLDRHERQWFIELLTTIAQQSTLVIIEKDIDVVTTLATHALILEKGKQVFFGSIDKVMVDSNLQQIGDFIPATSQQTWRSTKWPINVTDERLFIDRLHWQPSENFDPVVEDFSLSLKKGEIHAVLGKTGSGKTALCRLLAGLDKADNDGTAITVDNYSLAKNVSDRAMIVATVLSIPDRQLSQKSVLEELTFPIKVREGRKLPGDKQKFSLSDSELDQRIDEICHHMPFIKEFLPKDPLTLSFGLRKLINICSVLVVKPKVLVLDEPLVGLGFSGISILRQILEYCNLKEITVLVTAHENTVFLLGVHSATYLKKGVITFQGSIEKLTANEMNETEMAI